MKLPIGPGALVAAAFIGPGTVTACMIAGASFGYALIWALVFAIASTIILQEMASRLGLASGMGLGAALVHPSSGPVMKWTAILLGVSALAVGNAAYEGGNLAGGALGLEAIIGLDDGARPFIILGLSFIAGLFLLLGHYKHLEFLLVTLVILMSLAFVGSVVISRPHIPGMLSGVIPHVPEGGLLTSIALIGTTIVPYNLFLHASAVREKWPEGGDAALREARRDNGLSIGLGGLISILILTTAAASLYGSGMVVSSAGDMALALEPTYGVTARYLIGLGLLGAGLSSSITAPLATAYALTELIGLKKSGRVFRAIALGILIIGVTLSLSGLRPVSIILFAQVANGMLLPIVASFLLIAMNRKELLGNHTNSWRANVLGALVVLITFGLGLRLILRALHVWP